MRTGRIRLILAREGGTLIRVSTSIYGKLKSKSDQSPDESDGRTSKGESMRWISSLPVTDLPPKR